MTPQRRRGDLVRSFVITGGRSRPSRNTHVLDVITMVTATQDKPVTGLGPEQRAMVDLCRGGYLSVVEVAGHLRQPLTVTRVLLGDLLDTGHLVIRARESAPGTAELTDADILGRLLHGLQAL
ncbi:DUF742 domain-containing protein [Streptomyces sp. ACA25]|uniref:DUF742 domain-containing protein n=1 Tax=Streptomyces sp. ACA25 TaxID=3022596 RepID=UPI002307D33D|nr:DUF742 domain-containing protein [Streptomyces sp. ACA25]MDB1086585.1 DUF742 domain-containing protein [Streptomyces sp. ACA25]